MAQRLQRIQRMDTAEPKPKQCKKPRYLPPIGMPGLRDKRRLPAATPAEEDGIPVWPGADTKRDALPMRFGYPEAVDTLHSAQVRFATVWFEVASGRALPESELPPEGSERPGAEGS